MSEQIVTGEVFLSMNQLAQMAANGASITQHLVSAAYTNVLIKAAEEGIELDPDTIMVAVRVEGRGTQE